MASFEVLAEAVKAAEPGLSFTILEIGALPISNTPEPFHSLLEAFPGSQILAFELDPRLCDAMNKHLPEAMRYYATALGRKEETRALYETVMPMCTSLYRPNEALLSLYNHLEISSLKSIGSVETVSLDRFTGDHGVTDVDFIKIDVQGAELDVFEGGIKTVGNVFAIISEVEFVPLYIDQPLFGDVCRFLSQHGLMFHKFTSLGGRSLRPTILNDDPSYPVQLLWADGMFIRDVQKLRTLPAPKLLKLSVLAQLYGSPDLTFRCLELYDGQRGTQVLQKVLEHQ